MIIENQLKHSFWKKIITGDGAKKRQKDWSKYKFELKSLQSVSKEMKVIKLFEPINYWQIVANTQSN